MEQAIKKLSKNLHWAYAIMLLLTILCIVWGECYPEATGWIADDVRAKYLTETLTILLTALCTPLSLKLFAWALIHRINTQSIEKALKRYRCWSHLRLLMLAIPLYFGLFAYYSCLSLTGLLCTLIALVASLFCRTNEKLIKNQLHIEE